MSKVDRSFLEELRATCPKLSVHEPSSPEFQKLRLYYNRGLVKTPAVILRPTTEQQISQIIVLCRTQHVPFSIRSGGHDFFGRSLAPGGVVIDMRAMDTVTISPERTSATVEGGVIAGALQQTLSAHGLFTPTGQAKTVGYVAWACGGGYGFYVGTYGFGVDQILGARVVTADGRVVDTDQDRDLLWALRGAGAGAFGVVTELRVKVYPVPKLYAGFLAFPLSEAPEVLDKFQQLHSHGSLPDEFSGDAIISEPGMLQLTVSEPCFVFYWCWTAANGHLQPAEALLEKMVDCGTVLVNTVQETAPADFGGGDSSSVTFFRHCSVPALSTEIGEIFAKNPPPQPLSALVIHNNHGSGVRGDAVDETGACFPNRRQHIILGIHGGTTPDSTPSERAVEEATSWVNTLLKETTETRQVLKGGFPGFAEPDEVEPVEFFGAATAERLARMKRRLDPGNLFNKALPQLHQTSLVRL